MISEAELLKQRFQDVPLGSSLQLNLVPLNEDSAQFQMDESNAACIVEQSSLRCSNPWKTTLRISVLVLTDKLSARYITNLGFSSIQAPNSYRELNGPVTLS